MAINEGTLNELLGKSVTELGAAFSRAQYPGRSRRQSESGGTHLLFGLGAQAGEARLREVVMKGGFTRLRCATETPFDMVHEARP